MANPKDRWAQEAAPPIARHEFGHHVVARTLKFKVGTVAIKMLAPNGHYGSSVIEPATPLHDISDITSYIENRVVVLYSGSLAESLVDGKVNTKVATELLNSSASNDYAKIRELTHLLRSIRYPMTTDHKQMQDEYDEVWKTAWATAQQTVAENSDIIVGLGKILAKRVVKNNKNYEMTEDEIDETDIVKSRFSI